MLKNKILSFGYKILGYFAKKYIDRHNVFVIGVTGSVGKTSCRIIIYQILRRIIEDEVHRSSSFHHPSIFIYTSPKNFNGEYGLSLSILGIEDYSPNIFGFLKNILKGFFISFFGNKKYDVILLEYGIDHPGEMDFLLNIVKPNIGIITGIDKVHSMNFENLDQLANEKLKLAFNSKEVVFLNYDDTYVRQAYNLVSVDKFLFRITDQDLQYFSGGRKIEELKPDIWFENYEIVRQDNRRGDKIIEDNGGVSQNLLVYSEADVFIRGKRYNVRTNLIGKENMGYIGVGIAIAKILLRRFVGIDLNQQVFNFFIELLPGRFSIFEGIKDTIIIDSSYNAAPGSMKKVIENAYKLKQILFPERKFIVVLGDMRELGDFSEQEHRKLAGFVSQVADEIYLTGKMMKEFFKDELEKVGFSGKIKWFKNSRELGQYLKDNIKSISSAIILFKGSQNTIFLEEAIKFLLKNKSDLDKLPRMDKKWQNIKEKYFSRG